MKQKKTRCAVSDNQAINPVYKQKAYVLRTTEHVHAAKLEK